MCFPYVHVRASKLSNDLSNGHLATYTNSRDYRDVDHESSATAPIIANNYIQTRQASSIERERKRERKREREREREREGKEEREREIDIRYK